MIDLDLTWICEVPLFAIWVIGTGWIFAIVILSRWCKLFDAHTKLQLEMEDLKHEEHKRNKV